MRSYSHKNQNKNKSKKNKTQKNKRRNSYKNKRKNTYKNKKGQNGGAFGKGKTKKRLAALEEKVDGMSEIMRKIIKVVNLNKGNVRELAKQVRGMLALPGVRKVSRSNRVNMNNLRRSL